MRYHAVFFVLMQITSTAVDAAPVRREARAIDRAVAAYAELLKPTPGAAADAVRAGVREMCAIAPMLEIDDDLDRLGTPLRAGERLRPRFRTLASALVDHVTEASAAHTARDAVRARAAATRALVTVARAYAMAGANAGSRHEIFATGGSIVFTGIAATSLAVAGGALALAPDLHAPWLAYVTGGSGAGAIVALAVALITHDLRRETPGQGPLVEPAWVRRRSQADAVTGALRCFWSDVAIEMDWRAPRPGAVIEGAVARDAVFASLREVFGVIDLGPACARALTETGSVAAPARAVPRAQPARSGA